MWNKVIEIEIHKMWFMVIFFCFFFSSFSYENQNKQKYTAHSTHMFLPVLYFFNQLIFSFVCHKTLTYVFVYWNFNELTEQLSTCIFHIYRMIASFSLFCGHCWRIENETKNWKKKEFFFIFSFSLVLYEPLKTACIEFFLSVCRVLAL